MSLARSVAEAPAVVRPAIGHRWPAWLRLLIISFLTLYFELALIRWLPTEIRILAYFSNLTLISAVLGLGLGTLRYRDSWLPPARFFLLLAALIASAYVYHGLGVALPLTDSGYFLWNGLSRAATGTPLQYVALFVFVALNTLVCIPLGKLLGAEFDALPALRAYSINVGGALLGIGVFAFFSWYGLSPAVWFAVGVVLLLPLLPSTGAVWAGAFACVLLGSASSFEAGTLWSPYYRIQTRSVVAGGETVGFEVTVNDDSHQQALDLSGRFDGFGDMRTRRRIYDEPYRHGANGRVLILGSGTGNDVAAALRGGARSIEAVDIDPVILRLGSRHPESPYSDPRVHTINADGRSFLRRNPQLFDKIVLGYVDSHSLFSAMSSVRLDNFLYTEESFLEMKKHLAPEGVLAVTFTVHEKWIANRIFGLFEKTFGYAPLVFQGANSSSAGTVFMAGEPIRRFRPEYLAFDPGNGDGRFSWAYHSAKDGYLDPAVFSGNYELPTDDWPYLYMDQRGIPTNYLVSLAFLAVVALLFVRRRTGEMGLAPQFFFLGAGFLLVETKAMTELAIFLGSTWIVNALVIATILGLILIANLVVGRRWAPRTPIIYTLLLLTLILTYLLPLRGLLGWESPLRDVTAVTVLCLPLFFAGLIFAREITRESAASAALGSNLIGSLLGGMLEYSSMQTGLRPLYLLAFVLYGLAFASYWRAGRMGRVAERPQAALAAD